MANLLNKPFLQTQIPSLCFRRFRGKINIQRPRQPHYHRARVIAVTQPIYPKVERVKPCPETTWKSLNKQEENPYEMILAREVRNWFEHSQMVGIFHVNPINGEDFFKARVAFHKNGGMQLKKYGTSIMEKALIGSKFEVLMSLNRVKSFSTVYAFSPQHKNVASLLRIIKKIPQLHLMAGIVEGRLLSKNEFVDYSKLPDISIVQSQFTNVLNLAASQLVQNLQSHQSNLVNILDAHVRVNEKPKEEGAVEKNVEEAKNE